MKLSKAQQSDRLGCSTFALLLKTYYLSFAFIFIVFEQQPTSILMAIFMKSTQKLTS